MEANWSKTMIKPNELEWIMSNCYGTEKWYRYFPNNNFLYTDGVKTFCENAEAYWFISEVFLMVHGLPEDLYKITLKVEGSKADIIIIDGDCKEVKRNHIPFTDCPEGTWEFYYTDNVFLWYMEY